LTTHRSGTIVCCLMGVETWHHMSPRSPACRPDDDAAHATRRYTVHAGVMLPHSNDSDRQPWLGVPLTAREGVHGTGQGSAAAAAAVMLAGGHARAPATGTGPSVQDLAGIAGAAAPMLVQRMHDAAGATVPALNAQAAGAQAGNGMLHAAAAATAGAATAAAAAAAAHGSTAGSSQPAWLLASRGLSPSRRRNAPTSARRHARAVLPRPQQRGRAVQHAAQPQQQRQAAPRSPQHAQHVNVRPGA
jgi:hypothetical protein